MNTAATPSPFVASLHAAASARSAADEPAWLSTIRRENLQRFLAEGLPGTHLEAWKYTALRALAQRRFALGDEGAATRAVSAESIALPTVSGPRLTFVHGVFRPDLSSLNALPAGLTLQSLSLALREQPEPLRFALSRSFAEPADAFAQLNAALAHDGVVLRVAAGARIAEPVQLLFIGMPADADVAWHARNVIELGEGAHLTVFEHHLHAGEHRHLGTLLADVRLQRDAQLDYVVLQDAATGSTLLRQAQWRLEAQARARLHVLEVGGALVRHALQAELLGDGAQLDTHGVFALRGRQHVDTQLAIRHQALRTRSASVWRGVADDRARGVFRGAIVVAAGADGTDAALSNKNLLLSAEAEIDTKPELEIYADEVKAAHGATVGQLDPRALFYLRSRGIAQADARALLTSAFCQSVLAGIEHEALREQVTNVLQAHLPRAS